MTYTRDINLQRVDAVADEQCGKSARSKSSTMVIALDPRSTPDGGP